MSRPDATASAALGEGYIRPVLLGLLDFADEQVRANTSGRDLTPTATGDPDLDGQLFTGLAHDLITISSIKAGEGGTDSVTAEISGLPGLDDDAMEQIADPTNWQGREARLWRLIFDADRVQQGGIQAIYTGIMSALDISAAPESTRIVVTIEGYLASLASASGRTYLDQARYDPADLSARASIAIANGMSGAGAAGRGGGSGGSYGGGGGGGFVRAFAEQL